MKGIISKSFFASLMLVQLVSCATSVDERAAITDRRKVDFDILITREGNVVTNNMTKSARTKGAMVIDEDRAPVSLDENHSFGIIGVDRDTRRLVLDNQMVVSDGQGQWSSYFDYTSMTNTESMIFSAYFPYVNDLVYNRDGMATYTIPYESDDIDAGPLVSKTVETAVSKLSMIPLVFQHITNDVGFKISDVTPNKDLQGHIHLRKLVARNIASAGFYTDSLYTDGGKWKGQGYYRDVVVFDGDSKVGVGQDHELHVGYDDLVNSMADSHRFYAIPDEIRMGKQYVEVTYDIESFELDGYTYPEIRNQVSKYMIYGLLPGNTCIYGKMYTFHLGLDLSHLYQQITFTASVSDWETKIYESHVDF